MDTAAPQVLRGRPVNPGAAVGLALLELGQAVGPVSVGRTELFHSPVNQELLAGLELLGNLVLVVRQGLLVVQGLPASQDLASQVLLAKAALRVRAALQELAHGAELLVILDPRGRRDLLDSRVPPAALAYPEAQARLEAAGRAGTRELQGYRVNPGSAAQAG